MDYNHCIWNCGLKYTFVLQGIAFLVQRSAMKTILIINVTPRTGEHTKAFNTLRHSAHATRSASRTHTAHDDDDDAVSQVQGSNAATLREWPSAALRRRKPETRDRALLPHHIQTTTATYIYCVCVMKSCVCVCVCTCQVHSGVRSGVWCMMCLHVVVVCAITCVCVVGKRVALRLYEIEKGVKNRSGFWLIRKPHHRNQRMVCQSYH